MAAGERGGYYFLPLQRTGISASDKKIIIYFFNMCYGVYYHVVKFQLKTPPMHGEMKKTNYSRG